MRNQFCCLSALFVTLFQIGCHSPHVGSDIRWWPTQKLPKAVVRTTDHEKFEKVINPDGQSTQGAFGATHVLAQSLAGLTAKAVNKGKIDEMLWIEVGHPEKAYNEDYHQWYQDMMAYHEFKDRGRHEIWDLVRRYKHLGIIKGYVLYRYDYFDGVPYSPPRKRMDKSVNVATMMAGLLDAILIEEGQQTRAEQMGLNMLFDARRRTERWVFEKHKDQLNRKMVYLAAPKAPNCRGFAMAHNIPLVAELNEPLPTVLAWLDPPAAALGWSHEHENDQIRLISEYGHFQTASNWCINLPLLSAGSEKYNVKKIKTLDPRTIDFDDTDHAVSFVMSDGDNLQWYMGDFFKSKDYWGNPDHGKFPFGWTSCLASLSQTCPYTIDHLVDTQPQATSFIEFAGGYHFPDHFATERPNREELLRVHARRTWKNMQRVGVKVFGLICEDIDSPNALEAYQIYAEEMDGIVGIMAIQYHPYEGGDGAVYWVKNKRGIEIPVVTAKYAIWAHQNRGNKGTPARVARIINEHAQTFQQDNQKLLAWGIVHAWSRFKESPGSDEDAENVKAGESGQWGLTPVKWCVERIDPEVKVISPEELLWRIRMEYNPEQTRQEIKRFSK